MGYLSMLLAPGGDAATGAEGLMGGSGGLIIWLVIMVGVFYFILWKPQKKREKQERALRSSIQPGDQIVTIGGFVGRVLSVKDDEVVFETGADRTKLTVKKFAISQRTSPEQQAAAKEEEAAKEIEEKKGE